MLEYDNTSEKSIVLYAKKLIGKTLQDVLETSSNPRNINPKNKGLAGLIIEQCWFNIEQNSSQLPDFDKVGIELKIIPLKKVAKGIVVKERTKICNINYMKLYDEQWEESHAKEKLNKILFVYYMYDSKNILNSEILKIDLWELSTKTGELLIKNDWHYIKNKVLEGYAHTLSSKDTKSLEASPSGTKRLVAQPNKIYKNDAQKRAFSLKRPFTNQRWIEINNHVQYESIIETLNIKDLNNFEKNILEKLKTLENKSVLEISEMHNVPVGASKSRVASVIKKVIGFKSVRSKIKEFEQLGIGVKMINVREKDNRPLEAISFPAMKLREFILEEWEESTFLEMINKILFIPIYKEKKILDLNKQYVGEAFFWSPSLDELNIIKSEWLNYQNEVKLGKCKVVRIPQNSKRGYKEVSSLSKESSTRIIHMRPHGRDSNDRDEDSFGNGLVKQSFWLNSKFIQNLLNKKV